MSNIKVKATPSGWRVCCGDEVVSLARDEATAFQAALDYCSKLFLNGVRAQVILDKPAFRG